MGLICTKLTFPVPKCHYRKPDNKETVNKKLNLYKFYLVYRRIVAGIGVKHRKEQHSS